MPAGAVFHKEVEWLASTGISTGMRHSDGSLTFDPLQPVTRQAMAAFLHRLEVHSTT